MSKQPTLLRPKKKVSCNKEPTKGGDIPALFFTKRGRFPVL